MRIATASLRTGLAMTPFQEVRWVSLWCVGEGLCPSRGRGRTPPLRRGCKRCGEVWNPPVTASPCQPPLGKGAEGTGKRIATASVRTGLAMTGCKRCGRAGGVEPRPYGGQEDLCKPGVGRTEASAPTEGCKKCGGAGRCRHRPLRWAARGAVGWKCDERGFL